VLLLLLLLLLLLHVGGRAPVKAVAVRRRPV
jgi:hypothetical protein